MPSGLPNPHRRKVIFRVPVRRVESFLQSFKSPYRPLARAQAGRPHDDPELMVAVSQYASTICLVTSAPTGSDPVRAERLRADAQRGLRVNLEEAIALMKRAAGRTRDLADLEDLEDARPQ